MKILKSLILSLGMAASVFAQATTINFSSYSGTLAGVGNAHFSLAGVGEQGTPSVGNGYLYNSIDGSAYPTNSILKISFDESVSGVMFTFNTFGTKATTAWSLFGDGHTLISTGHLSNGDTLYNLSQYSGVRSIEYNNGGNDWYFGVKNLSFNVIPEPGMLPLLGLGMAGLMLARRRRAA